MKVLSLGYSPCPNDTFVFYALVHGKIDTGDIAFRERLEDVETLNLMAHKGRLDITKVSYGAFSNLRGAYCLIRSGGALGRGCGPLVVARAACRMRDIKGKRIAVPGLRTTAYLLLQLYDPAYRDNVVVMPFHEIMAAVRNGDVEAGLIIHESRFTYPAFGLTEIADLGRWWEEKTGYPIPLGGIIAKRSLGMEIVKKVEGLVRESVLYAMKNQDEPNSYVKEHSQELEDGVIQEHIKLYVNDYSIDVGDDGLEAVEALFRMAEERGIIQKSKTPVFFE